LDLRPVVAFGDSHTEGIGAIPERAYPAVLERLLGVPVENAGWRGETAFEALSRLPQEVLDRDPRLVLVEFGGNEALRGEPVERALSGLDAILAELSSRRVPTILVGVTIPEYGSAWDDGLRALAIRHDAELVLHALDGILGDPACTSDDEWHLNANGYRKLAERLAPVVEKALERAR